MTTPQIFIVKQLKFFLNSDKFCLFLTFITTYMFVYQYYKSV